MKAFCVRCFFFAGSLAIAIALPNAHAAGKKPKAKASAPPATSMELVSLEELSLGKPAGSTTANRNAKEPAAPKDSLDGILGRATVTEPDPSQKAVNRMRLLNDKEKSPTVMPEKVPVPAPTRITQDVTSSALAAAKASAAANTSKVNASAKLPVLAGKVTVNDDPLLGVNAKEIEGKRDDKNRTKRGK